MNFDYYRDRVLRKGGSSQEIILSEMKKGFEDFLEVAPNAFTVLVNNTEEQLVTIQDKTITKDFTTEKYLLSNLDSSIDIGDTFLWSEDFWIVTYKDSKTVKSHQRYIIAKCNNTLTYQTPNTKIHTIPCIITDRASVYSDGVEDTNLIRLPDGLIKIVIPNNELTNTFDLLNKRVIFDCSKESIFGVTKVGKLLKKGLIEIIAEVKTYDENVDNLELNLSNYTKTDEDENPTEPDDPIALNITGENRVSVWDTPITYTVNTDEAVLWSVIGDTMKIQSQSGNSCVVKEIDSSTFGESILRVELVSDSSIFAEKSIEIVFM